MKKINTWGFVIFVAIMTIVGSSQLAAQTTRAEVVSFMRNAGGWQESTTNRYAYLKEGESSAWWYRTFLPGYEYAIVGFSEDEDVLDIDLKVQTTNAIIYEEDEDEDDWAIVRFSVNWERRLGIKIINYASLSPLTSECRFIVFFRKSE